MLEMGLLLNALITLLVTIDPVGLVPIFLSLTEDMSASQRRLTALTAAIIAFFILMLFAVAGTAILHGLGISIGAFQMAGGILLFAIAFEMIFEKRSERKQKTATIAITKDHIRNIAAFPLALPMIAGPGAISAIILMASENRGFIGMIASTVVIFIAIIICYALMMLATPLDRILGDTGRTIVTRLFGVLLAALAVQFVANAIVTIFNLAPS